MRSFGLILALAQASIMVQASILAQASVTPAAAAEPSSIAVERPWLRATPKGAPVVGGYATIRNGGSTADTLLSASIPMAPKGEVHSMTMAGGVMRMKRLAAGLPIAPGATVILAPGGDHMMFTNPTARLVEGQTVTGSLTFAKAGTVPVIFTVAGMAAKSPPGDPALADPAAGKPASRSRQPPAGAMDMKGMR